MLEAFIYPVSGVMKLWHLLFYKAFGLENSLAWVLSIFGLVITVRALIAPLNWMMYRSSRASTLVRPKLKALDEELDADPTAEKYKEISDRKKAVNKEHGVNPLAGCLPALIQIPFFLGLYQVLIRMARPKEGLDSASHAQIGMLTSDDVSGFLESNVAGFPLPAYPLLPEESLTRLGTTAEDVAQFLWPWVIVAACFTFFNMLMSLIRNQYALDYSVPLTLKMNRFIIAMTILAPLMLLVAGATGGIPVAIILYWVANNCWTFAQTGIMFWAIKKKYPYTEEYLELFHTSKAEHKAAKKEHKQHKRAVRSLRLKGIFSSDARAEAREMKTARAEKLAQEKTEKKEIKRKRNEAMKAHTAAVIAERKKKREEKAAAEGAEADGAETEAEKTAEDTAAADTGVEAAEEAAPEETAHEETACEEAAIEEAQEEDSPEEATPETSEELEQSGPKHAAEGNPPPATEATRSYVGKRRVKEEP